MSREFGPALAVLAIGVVLFIVLEATVSLLAAGVIGGACIVAAIVMAFRASARAENSSDEPYDDWR